MIKRSSLLLLLLAVLTLGAAGCSKRHRIEVQSDTCWSGKVNDDQFISDCGNATFKVIGTLRCVKVSKSERDVGYLRVRIDDQPWADTPDQYGIVQTCN